MNEKHTFPLAYGEDCILVAIDAALVPILSGQLRYLEERRAWLSDTDYEKGYNAFIQVRSDMNNRCLQDLIESNNRLYRLMDTALNGTAYSATPATAPPPALPADPTRPTFAPAIPLVPSAMSPATLPAIALRHRIERIANLLDNLITGQQFPPNPAFMSSDELPNGTGLRETITEMQGMIDVGWFNIGGQKATLADIVTGVRQGSQEDKARVLNALDLIVGASSSATIFNTVRSLFTDSVDLGLEGAQFTVLLVATMSQILSNSLVGGQLDRIVRALDGGGLLPPGDNVLQALRGDENADAARNLATLATETRDLLEP